MALSQAVHYVAEDICMPGIDFTLIRSEITMQNVLDALGFEPSSVNGHQLRGPCPIHRSISPRSRSLSVHVVAGRFYCHKCHRNGNQLDLWAAVHDLPIYDAAIDLCREIGKDVPWIARSTEQQRRGTGTSG